MADVFGLPLSKLRTSLKLNCDSNTYIIFDFCGDIIADNLDGSSAEAIIHAVNNHDRRVEENEKLRQRLDGAVDWLDEVELHLSNTDHKVMIAKARAILKEANDGK